MGRLRGGALAGLLVLSACTSVPPRGPGAVAPGAPAPGPEAVVPSEPGPRTPTLAPSFEPTPAPPQASGPLPSPLDLDHWPFGWVDDGEGARLGHPDRFWTDRRPLWTEALDPATPAFRAARLLEGLTRAPASAEEAFRAAWHLAAVDRRAGLADEARAWLDRAGAWGASPVVDLERAWDQAFRLQDRWGAWALVPDPGSWPRGDDARRAALLRQRLFLGVQSLAGVGADDYVSCLVLDRDDLWAGTWNGAVVRWSLAGETLERISPPAEAVAPVKALAATRWFLYAFQDRALFRYSKVTGAWRSFPYPPGWTGLRVGAVGAEGEETLWVAALGPGLWKWDRGQWSLEDEGGGGPFLNTLAPDGQGGLWIGTKDRGLWHRVGGAWTPVTGPSGAPGPTNISVLAADPEGRRWAVGTWGEGTWILEDGALTPVSGASEYVTGAAWAEGRPLWGTLDEGLVWNSAAGPRILGPREGLPAGGVTSLIVWEGRWLWGTNGQGLGWWSEHENPALPR